MEIREYIWAELSSDVKEALLALVKWKDEGFPEHPHFTRRVRLCRNVVSFLEHKGMDRVDATILTIDSMERLTRYEGLKGGAYPFEGKVKDLQDVLYSNPKRLNFIETCRRKLA
ncbi:hypothetical protein PAK_P30118 [Pseudomonas phage PAK_P3]|uniref:Uncharacterized protein n=3 Tax=Nankokuvirus TaxID=1925779 RepID=A0A0K0L990_9CAUD|nr:hypothetical protein PAK_P30118 [Pseudomonas phage PAK_P3]YP_009205970.1 hypothetical protein AVT15_gp005 [Pseudomonas phage vB_PaeM_PS24]ADX32131.1 hypothetical protein P3_CHA0120 [Pseudomonas phage P3_CHA]ADX32316.1 hypothetical protein PAK_P30118 [Pseudomonas phage PAK_P3]AIW01710.1 hypothetical protein vB_PaeM_PS2400005 [Pseudomonas phage vB_PaeM_PS24]